MSVAAGRWTGEQSARRRLLEHHVSRQQPISREEEPESLGRECVRRTGHDPKTLPWQAQITEVDLHDRDRVVNETPAELSHPGIVELNGYHPSARDQEGLNQCATACPEIQDEVSRIDRRTVDDPLSPFSLKPVPAPLALGSRRWWSRARADLPARARPGHDAP